MTCQTRQMFFWILSAAFLTGSVVFSAKLPAKNRLLSPRHLAGTGSTLQCGPYYGMPSPADCEAVAENIRAFRRTLFGSTSAYNEYYDEFIIRGAEEQHADCSLHWSTPFYWRTGPYTGHTFQPLFGFPDTDARSVGTCIGALFVDQSINGATADVERWLDIYETAQNVVDLCVTRHGFGGKNRGDLGVERHSLVTVFYGPGSPADDDVGQAVVCPTCNQEQCPATASEARCPFWNVFPGRVPQLHPPNLQNPAGAGVRYDEATVCGSSCKSQRDCGCADYLCLGDYTKPARLRATNLACVFVPLSSQMYPVLSGFGMKRDLGGALDPEVAARCVCDVDHFGPECCGKT